VPVLHHQRSGVAVTRRVRAETDQCYPAAEGQRCVRAGQGRRTAEFHDVVRTTAARNAHDFVVPVGRCDVVDAIRGIDAGQEMTSTLKFLLAR
jgi:hypothetical protein